MPERFEASAGMFAYIDRKVRIEEKIREALQDAFDEGVAVGEGSYQPDVQDRLKENASGLLKAIREIDGEWVEP